MGEMKKKMKTAVRRRLKGEQKSGRHRHCGYRDVPDKAGPPFVFTQPVPYSGV